MPWTVTPMCVGYFPSRPKASITYMHNWYDTIDLAIFMFLIKNGSDAILVDTGTHDEDVVQELHKRVLVRPEEHLPANRLRAEGIDPYDVPLVVNTHLHWDHCANNSLFPKADFVVQKRELAYAADPLPIHRVAYEKKRGVVPPWAASLDRIQTVDGDTRIADGIDLVLLPGHSPGSQGVLVETATGPVLIAGDCVDTYENWKGTENVPHIPSSGHTDLIEFFASFDKIDALGAEVVPSHDPLVEGKRWG